MKFFNRIFVKKIKEKERNLQNNARLVSGKWTFCVDIFIAFPKISILLIDLRISLWVKRFLLLQDIFTISPNRKCKIFMNTHKDTQTFVFLLDIWMCCINHEPFFWRKAVYVNGHLAISFIDLKWTIKNRCCLLLCHWYKHGGQYSILQSDP